ncbi:MAG TPA: dienelactone hydrolase family protein [Burkholderiaceae bacterium]|nr:dienelactone hydrolase family protein [Burkholderiaceae bacterium]
MKKWVYRTVAALAAVLVLVTAVVLIAAQRTERPVGFDVRRATNSLGRPFAIALWYPTSAAPWPTTLLGVTLMSVARGGAVEGQRLPLVILSHGNGGGAGSHADLALALADAGYVVAAPIHSGDNFEDGTGLGSPRFWSNRNQELRASIDYMLNSWSGRSHLDPSRIGVFGFSAGGFTALNAIGGRPDLRAIPAHCARTPEFVCEVLRAGNSPLLKEIAEPIDQDFVEDARLQAAVIVAPGLGFTFANGGLRGVAVPVQIWTGQNDRATPDASNGAVVRSELGSRIEAHSVPGAGHASFLAPCHLLRPPGLCEDEPGFDRAAFHKWMNAEVVDFFNRTLKH